MYDLNGIKTLLEAGTSINIDFSKSIQPNLMTGVILPSIFIGYNEIRTPSESNLGNILDIGDQQLKQTFDLHIYCTRINLPTIWRQVYKALSGKNTQPGEELFSGLAFSTGGVISLVDDNIWWLDRWVVDFPTLNTF